MTKLEKIIYMIKLEKQYQQDYAKHLLKYEMMYTYNMTLGEIQAYSKILDYADNEKVLDARIKFLEDANNESQRRSNH